MKNQILLLVAATLLGACSANDEEKVSKSNTLDSLLIVANIENQKRNETDSLMNLLGVAMDSMNHLQKEIQEVRQRKGSIRGSSGMTTKVSQLEQLLQQSMSKITQLQDKLRDAEMLNQQANSQIQMLGTQLNKLNELNQQQSGDNSQIAALQTQVERLKEMQRQNIEKDQQIKALISQMEKLKINNTQSSAAIGGSNKEVEELKALLETQKDIMRKQMATYQQEIANLKQQVNTTAADKGLTLPTSGTKEVSNAGLLRVIDQLKEQLLIKEEEIVALRAELKGVKEVLVVVNQEREALAQTVVQKEQELKTTQEVLSQQQQQAETLKKQMKIVGDIRNLLAEGDSEIAKGDELKKGLGKLFKKNEANEHYQKALALYRRAADLAYQQTEIPEKTIREKIKQADEKLK